MHEEQPNQRLLDMRNAHEFARRERAQDVLFNQLERVVIARVDLPGHTHSTPTPRWISGNSFSEATVSIYSLRLAESSSEHSPLKGRYLKRTLQASARMSGEPYPRLSPPRVCF